jgi:hypothetical protein
MRMHVSTAGFLVTHRGLEITFADSLVSPALTLLYRYMSTPLLLEKSAEAWAKSSYLIPDGR